MTLQQCKYIIEISNHNSISKAAKELNMMQPSISKSIKDLENELDIKIFDRTNKGVIFTKEGSELLIYAKKLIEQEELIKFHFNKSKNRKKEINISSQYFGFVSQSIAHFINIYKNDSFEIIVNEGKAIDIIEDVYSNKSHFGIISISDNNKDFFKRHFKSKSLTFSSMVIVNQSVFLRKEHPLATKKFIDIDELKNYTYLSYIKNDILLSNSETKINKYFTKQVVYINDRGTMNNLLSKTDGFNIGTGVIIQDYIDKNIISIPLQNAQKIQIGLVKRTDSFFSEETKIFINYLEESLHKIV